MNTDEVRNPVGHSLTRREVREQLGRMKAYRIYAVGKTSIFVLSKDEAGARACAKEVLKTEDPYTKWEITEVRKARNRIKAPSG